MRRITIFDTTLRDGDQAAGFSFGAKKKLALAAALAEAGVNVIETGFPLSSKIDFEVCRTAARELAASASSTPASSEGPLTAVMCRGRREDIAESAKVFSGGIPGILHISLPVSKIHIEAKLRRRESEIIAMAREAVAFAAGLVSEVELGAEDAFRADRNFLLDYCEAALDAGARIINIADTLGGVSPTEARELAEFLCAGIKAFAPEGAAKGGAVLSIHCHNDLGLACANTLAALEAGCGQAEVSVSGIGERAGNAALEEVAANIGIRSKEYGMYTTLKPEKFPCLLRAASEAADSAFSLMKPLSGWNTRAHSSGIHQQGLSKNAETYSLPALKAWTNAPERIVLSRHSGQAGTALFAKRYCGLVLDEETIVQVTREIKKSEAVTGITEFLCILSDGKKLPPAFPGPLVCVSFKETLRSAEGSADKGKSPEVTIEAVLKVYGGSGDGNESSREISGRGEDEATAVSEALGGLGCPAPEFSRIATNGFGGRLRLYAEISFDSERLYALERAGASAAELLFLCGLDAINAEAVNQQPKRHLRSLRNI
jgi:2-isopropylmalate synthase